MLLFVDTEFADVGAQELVSLALVSETGDLEFYAERDPLPSAPTEFVRSVVYPLLNRGERALTDEQFTRELKAFLARVIAASGRDPISVAYDFRGDIHLVDHVLDGFTSPPAMTRPDFEVVDLGLLGGDAGPSRPSLRKTQ